jgi:NodT family efflux transporter outer membrane factor (OMF) lipoprotein
VRNIAPVCGLTCRVACVAVMIALDACAVGPDFVHPQSPSITHYNSGSDPDHTAVAHGTAQKFQPAVDVSADWWRMFKSTKLETLVSDSLGSNENLQAAQARLRASQDNLRAGYGIFYPNIEGDASFARQRFSPLRFGQNAAPGIFNLFTLSASVTYALDLFGGEHRTVEGLAAQTDLQQATVRATAVTLTSNVVNTAIAKAAYAAEIETTRQLVEIETEQVRIAMIQADAGTGPYSAVLSLESQLHSLQSTLPQLEQKLVQADHLLHVLTGKTPADAAVTDISFDEISLPQNLPVSLPSMLVRQRPDILAAEASLHVATANIGVATAALFPTVTVTAGYGANNTSVNNLFDAKGQFWSFGAGIAQPLFDGGTLWFKRKAAKDLFDASLSDYRQTVLNALEQVADTLRALEHDATILSEDDQALSAAEQALHLVQTNYQAGLANYTQVLITDGQYHQARIADMEALAVRYQDTVALYAALGGGWQNLEGRQLSSQ